MNLGQMRAKLLVYLATASTDRAYPPASLNGLLNDALSELRAEAPADAYVQTATWTPDGGTGRVYSLGSQAPAVNAIQAPYEIRLDSTTGTRLRRLAYEQMLAYDGPAYALIGVDLTAKVVTSDWCADGASLFVKYTEWAATLAVDADVPSWLPAAFHDVPCLMAAELAFSLGDEGKFPSALAGKLMDRRAQLLQWQTRPDGDVMKQRDQDAVIF